MLKAVTVYRYRRGKRSWRFTTRWFKGAKFQIAGSFKRLYEPISGTDEDYWSYWGNGSWPQPSYNQINMMRPRAQGE